MTTLARSVRFAIARVWPLLAAAASAQTPAAPLRVLDAYEVGPNVYVRALTVEAATGTLWVGTSAGVHEVDIGSGKLRNTFTRKEGLANEYVFAVGIDRDSYKWFGTNAGGVSKYKDGKWKTFFPMHGLADYWIYAFAQQRNGDFWIGTWAGANKISAPTLASLASPQGGAPALGAARRRAEAGSGRFRTYVKELVNEWVYGIAVDAQDRVWFGTEGGVTMHDGKAWRSWTHKDGLGAPNDDKLPFSTNTGLGTRSRHDLSVGGDGPATYNPNYVFSMLAARDGGIWAGTWGGGAARFDGQGWRNLTAKDGLAGNIVYAITQDRDGAIWFGTNNGVSRWDGRQWTNLGPREGLLDVHVYAVAATPNGEVWAGTRKGVVRIGR